MYFIYAVQASPQTQVQYQVTTAEIWNAVRQHIKHVHHLGYVLYFSDSAGELNTRILQHL